MAKARQLLAMTFSEHLCKAVSESPGPRQLGVYHEVFEKTFGYGIYAAECLVLRMEASPGGFSHAIWARARIVFCLPAWPCIDKKPKPGMPVLVEITEHDTWPSLHVAALQHELQTGSSCLAEDITCQFDFHYSILNSIHRIVLAQWLGEADYEQFPMNLGHILAER